MHVVFIYFDEIPLQDDNKFMLDFSNEEIVQKVKWNKKIDYYIASLDSNLVLKEEMKKIGQN